MRMLYLEVKESAWINDTSRKSGSASSLLLLLPLPTGFFPSNWRFFYFFPIVPASRWVGKAIAQLLLCSPSVLSLPVTGRSDFFLSFFLFLSSSCLRTSLELFIHFYRTNARSWLTSIKLPDSVMSNCCGGCCWLNDSQRVRESPLFTKACCRRIARENERERFHE